MKGKPKCNCGNWMENKEFNVEGFKIKGWQCRKCKRIEYSEEINKVLAIKKLKKNPLTVKIGQLGESRIVRLPKELQQAIEFKKGEKVRIYPESLRKITIETS